MFYNARWYDSTTGRFAQADSIVPAGVQGYDRCAYVNNSPVNFTDPSGHCIWDGCVFETTVLVVATATIVSRTFGVVMLGTSPDTNGINNAEQYVSNSGDTTSTYTAAGIAVQSNYYPLGDKIYRNRYTSGFGLAQVSQKDLDSEEYGMRGADPSDPNVAVAAMQKRISLVTGMCNGMCSQTDIFIASALAQNAGFKKEDMQNLVNGVYGTPNTSDPTKNFLPWETFLNRGDNSYNRLMLRMFKNDVQALGNSGWKVPDIIDWGYIDRQSKGGWRSAW
jgi:hypothetical protein